MKWFNFTSVSLFFGGCFFAPTQAQFNTNKEGSSYSFEKISHVENTKVKDQCKTATCWSYSTLSLIESDLIRKNKGNHDLSEMYIARCAYVEKAITYVRMNGKHQFDEGGEGHDINYIISKYGIVPEEIYTGLLNGKIRHDHSELVAVLKSVVETVVKQPSGKIGTEWIGAINGILDAYLGKIPTEFTYRGKNYNPKTFAESLELNQNQYKIYTSFTHHPFYQSFAIEVPDNWSMQMAENLPLNEMTQAVDKALKKGISVAWAADVSEKGFSFRDGIALIPMHDSLIKKEGQDNKQFNNAGAERKGNAFTIPCEQKLITQESRQEAFDAQQTTDDHGMHIVGLYKEKSTGMEYYLVKNSWGTVNNLNGYIFVSKPYFLYKTISVMFHQDGIK